MELGDYALLRIGALPHFETRIGLGNRVAYFVPRLFDRAGERSEVGATGFGTVPVAQIYKDGAMRRVIERQYRAGSRNMDSGFSVECRIPSS